MQLDQQIAIDTWNVCESKLARALRGKLEPHKGDPKPLKKHGGQLDIMRLRILPIRSERVPSQFWDGEWCLYEIGVGKYPDQRLGLGGIQFFQFSDNDKCGNGAYHDRLLPLLRDVQLKRSSDFHLETHSGDARKPGRKPGLARYYHAKPFKTFPLQVAGEDIAWLISETLPAIQRFIGAA